MPKPQATSIIQRKGLPKSDLAETLVTRWSIIPHTCLFRRSIIEKSGGFPEDMRVAEDQLFFLNCLLAGARVVHTPSALTLYREGNSGKLSESKLSERSRDWSLFLLRARKRLIESGRDDPLKDSRFRQRLWQAKQDLGKQAPELQKEIDDLLGGHKQWFTLRKKLSQYAAGFKQRVMGCRMDSSFRTTPILKQEQKIDAFFSKYV